MAKTHGLKPGDRVTLNTDALSPGNAAYWRQFASARVGTVVAPDERGRVVVDFGNTLGVFDAGALTVEVMQPGLGI